MPTPAIPSKLRIVQYLAASIAQSQAFQTKIAAYCDMANTAADAKARMMEADTLIEQTQAKLVAALSAQVAG